MRFTRFEWLDYGHALVLGARHVNWRIAVRTWLTSRQAYNGYRVPFGRAQRMKRALREALRNRFKATRSARSVRSAGLSRRRGRIGTRH